MAEDFSALDFNNSGFEEMYSDWIETMTFGYNDDDIKIEEKRSES